MIEFYEKMNLFVEQLEMLKQNLMVQTDIIGWMTAGSMIVVAYLLHIVRFFQEAWQAPKPQSSTGN